MGLVATAQRIETREEKKKKKGELNPRGVLVLKASHQVPVAVATTVASS